MAAAPDPARAGRAAPLHEASVGPTADPAPPPGNRAPGRTVIHGEALAWLRAQGRIPGASIVTSLPDVSELPGADLDHWQRWFEEAAALTCAAAPDDGVVIFFQSDIKQAGLWIDKGALVARAARQAGLALLFHKIVCRKPPGTVTFARAGYSHLLAFARTVRPPPGHATADVLPDTGFRSAPKAMGITACQVACRFILTETPTRTVVDPFCGYGTVLAVANALGLDAVGVDLSARMCRKARTLAVDLATGRPRARTTP